jgi:hypothetical protein
MEEPIVMKKIVALAVIGIASQTIVAFAGPPEPKQVVAPPPPPPEYFRPNEFDIGAFATWVDFPNSRNVGGSVHGWGGGMDFTYWFPWKYAGVRFQGTGLDIQSGIGHTSRTFTDIFGQTRTVHFGGGSFAAGVLNADLLLRLPLDDFWPGVHLAPYVFGGFGGILTGGGGGQATFNETVIVTNLAGTEAREVTIRRRLNNIRNNIGTDRVLGRIGGGLEYRFTPNIGIFTEASYDIVNGASNNFVQFNFIGLRYAF